MRKLGSEKQAEEKRKRNTLILSVFILFILIGGTAGYAFITNPYTTTNNNQQPTDINEPRLVGNRWAVPVQGQTMYFTNSPESVSEIPVEITATLATFRGRALYFDSSNEAINAEIATTLGTYASRVQQACHGPCEEDLPEKDCSENIIIWTDSAENNIYQEDGCIFIEGDMRAVDAFLFQVLKS